MAIVANKTPHYGFATLGAILMLLLNTFLTLVLVLPIVVAGLSVLLMTSARSSLTK